MDPQNYYVVTLTNAFTKLAPYVAFILGGYFVFIKLPFLFLKKSLDQQKKNLQVEEKGLQVKVEEKKYSIDDYERFKKNLKMLNTEAHSTSEKKAESKKELPKKEEPKKKQETKRPEPLRPASSSSQGPEEVLGFMPNETFTKSELKKRYFNKLKENHPDRVASMGEDFKKLAENNTKEINKAYEKLKKRAA